MGSTHRVTWARSSAGCTRLFILLLLLPAMLIKPSRAAAATATVTDIASPDAYTCAQSGYIDFERMPDGTNLSSGAINGVQFTTTNGFTWLVGDFSTGNYNGKYPDGGPYTSQGTHWAWLGPNQGAGRIDFVDGPASVFSLLVSDSLSPVRLDAYGANNSLLATAGPAPININTGHMAELKITRDTADIAYVIVHDAGNFFLVDSVCTNAPGVPRASLFDFKQNRNADASNVPWALDHLYDMSGCGTMAGYGCAITSLTDILASYGLTALPNGAAVDPGAVNHYLGLPSNAGTHVGCGIYWAPAGRALNYTIRDYRSPTTAYSDKIRRIDEALAANNLVILGIPQGGGKHFMVLYLRAPDAPDGSPDYFIADPYRYAPYATGDRSGRTLYQGYGRTLQQMASEFQVDVVENQAPQPGRAWAIVARSPVELLITSPSGAQSGFNPATGTYVLDIPGSSYGPEAGIVDDNGEFPTSPSALYFGQDPLEDGTYTIHVIGTGTGPYTLDFSIASGPMDTSVQTVAGTAAPGEIDTYFVVAEEGRPITVERLVTTDIKPNLAPNPINLKSGGVIPIAVLTTPTFDAATVDPLSVRFGPNGASEVHQRGHMEDVDGDGDLDLVLHFRVSDTGLAAGDNQACLTGSTVSGVAITGCDAISVVP